SYPTVGGKALSTDFLKQWREALSKSPYFNVHDWLQHLDAENKQGNITAAECNKIIHKLSLKPFESENKILVLWMPEFLVKEGNRLLKIIEEPPSNTYFIFVAENTQNILPTILSRCQLLKVPALSTEVIEQQLRTEGVDPLLAKSVSKTSQGNFRMAQKILGVQDDSTSKLFLDWMRKAWQGNGKDIVDVVNEISGMGREKQKYLLQYGLHFLRECLVMGWQDSEKIRLLETELVSAQKMSRVLDWQKIESMSSLMDDCTFYVERNANPRILFMDASFKLHQIFKEN
ncbi:MAG: hypothetical protein HKN16_11445, partial [Saprospiraceae bacterium]|nr:hypothetical protein [Saprospiraceae bacterium]